MSINQFQREVNDLTLPSHLEFFADKKVLITGASGLLGNYLRAFFDNLADSFGVNMEIHSISKTGSYVYPISKYNVTHVKDLSAASARFYESLPNFDVIIHGATYGQPSKFLSEKLQTISLNSGVTLSLIAKLTEKGVFLFISSSEVYSGLVKTPFHESEIGRSGPDHPRAAYIESKRIGETIVNSVANDETTRRAHAARLALAYGPGFRDNDKRVLNELLMQAVKDRKITLKDLGFAKRTYCYIVDVLEMLLGIIISGKEPTYNVGGISRTTIADLAQLIARVTKSSLEFPDSDTSSDLGAPNDVSMDLTRIKLLTSKDSFIGLEEGIDRTISWYSNYRLNRS